MHDGSDVRPNLALNDTEYSNVPAILVLTDSDAGERAARDTADALGARISDAVRLENAVARLDTQIGMDALMVEVAHDDPDAVDTLFNRIDALVRVDRIPSCVSVPLSLLDHASARLGGGPVSLLCQPDAFDRVSALGLALHRSPVLNDISRETDSMRLRHLADEVSRIAQALSRLTPEAPQALRPVSAVNDMLIGFRAEPILSPIDHDAPLASEIRSMIRLRRMRDRFFDSELFADPAWDMLLDLAAARLERKQVAVSSLCIAAAVPPTTALRWIKAMTDNGLFERCADPEDGRRIFIRLADHTADAMANYLAAIKKSGEMMV